jgi:hypothetical protein
VPDDVGVARLPVDALRGAEGLAVGDVGTGVDVVPAVSRERPVVEGVLLGDVVVAEGLATVLRSVVLVDVSDDDARRDVVPASSPLSGRGSLIRFFRFGMSCDATGKTCSPSAASAFAFSAVIA